MKIEDTSHKVLTAREERASLIQNKVRQSQLTVVALRINTPGAKKNTPTSRILLNIFNHVFTRLKPALRKEYHSSLDGDFTLFMYDEEALDVKKFALFIEDNHPLGRYIDCDVYSALSQVSRRDLNIAARTCFLCTRPAHICVRDKRHSQKALKAKIDSDLTRFLVESFARDATISLRNEVYYYPKFGLVSARNNGIHTDMNISHFLASIKALSPFFFAYAQEGLTESIQTDRLKQLGQDAEKAMTEATNGVNTHKGANYLFGCILPLAVHTVLNEGSQEDFQDNLKSLAAKVNKGHFEHLKNSQTAGEKVYQLYGIKGIRGEVSEGLPSIFNWSHKTYTHSQKFCAIMARLDDTTIIKRKNYTTLRRVKDEMQALLDETPFRDDYYLAHSLEYQKDFISPGGAADMFAVALFIETIKPLFNKNSLQ